MVFEFLAPYLDAILFDLLHAVEVLGELAQRLIELIPVK